MSKITLLDVPFGEKDQAKAIGARWNPVLKQWYVPENLELEPFKKWVPIMEDDIETVANAPIYLLETYTSCWRCEKNSRVIAIASAGINDEISGQLVVYSHVRYLPEHIFELIKSNYAFYYKDFSKTSKSFYYINHCACKVSLGDFFMHNEPGGAFHPLNDEHAKDIKMVKIQSKGRIKIAANHGFSDPDYISEAAQRYENLGAGPNLFDNR
jgi:hypothetical protein